MLIYTPDQLPMSNPKALARSRERQGKQVAPSLPVRHRNNNPFPSFKDRRRQKDRRKQNLNIQFNRRKDDRRRLHLRTSKTVKTLIDNSDNPNLPGNNHRPGKFIYEKV